MMNRFFAALILVLSPVPSMAAWEFPYSYVSLSVEEGLSQPNVTAILPDKRGTVWIGTKDGLNRLDRREIKAYTSKEDGSAYLPDNCIDGLDEGPDGTVWIRRRCGLSRYLPLQDAFDTVLDSPVFSALSCPDGIFFGGEGILLKFAVGQSVPEEMRPFGTDPEYASITYRICGILDLGGGELLLGTMDGGLFRYRPGGIAIRFNGHVGHQLTKLYLTPEGEAWAAYYGDGIRRYGPDGRELAHYTVSSSGLTNDYVQDFAEYDGCLWIATDGGGICILRPDGTFTSLSHLPEDPDSLPSNSVTILCPDPSSGTLWAGTVKRGFFQVGKNYIRSLRGPFRGLKDNALISLYRDGDGTLWVGTDGGGIHRFDEASCRFTPLPGTSGKILSIAAFDNRRLLASIYMEGFFLVDKLTGHKEPFILIDRDVNRKECFTGILPRIGQVSADKLYFLGFSPYVYDLRTHTFRQMETEPEGVRVDAIRMACSDAERSFFYRGNRVFLVKQSDDVIRPVLKVGNNEKVTSLAFGSGTVWVGTDRGLGRFDLASGEYTPVASKLIDSVSAMELDPEGRLWICARNHLLTYLVEEGRFITWSASDGFRPNDIKMLYQNSIDASYLYMGGSGGLVQVDRNIPVPGEEAPSVFLEQLHVDGKSALLRMEGNSVRVPWNYQSLSASFLVKDSDVFQRKLFRYTVDGDRERTFDSYDASLTLTTLSPGTYHVDVSYLTKGGVFTEPVQLLEVTVLPPWYGTLWFRLAVTLLVLAGAVLLLRNMHDRHEHANKNSMAMFLEGMLQEPGSQEVVPSPDPGFKERLDEAILENLSDPDLDVQFLTGRLLMSRTSLYSKVKQVTGMGIKDYINRMRIGRSVELLLNTDKTISEISYEVGFSYPRYFSTSFKNMKGMTPTRFKQENSPQQS